MSKGCTLTDCKWCDTDGSCLNENSDLLVNEDADCSSGDCGCSCYAPEKGSC